MMKRGEIILIILSLIVISGLVGSVNAQEINKIKKAYQCLDSIVGNATLTLDEAIFSSLANAPGNRAIGVINNEKSSTEFCWPKTGCNVKTTAQVALVYDHLGRDNKDIISWILSKNGTVSGFMWYLQTTIDGNEISQCKVSYDGVDYTFNVNNEMKLIGNTGQCLIVDGSGYRMRISNNCLDKIYNVNCDKGYKINLLYEKDSGGTLYVSSRTESGSANSWKSLGISAKCFKEGDACNYESSLWATTSLYASNKDYVSFVPYLRVLEEDNQRLFPAAFLNYIEPGNQHYAKIIESKNDRPQERAYWEVGGNRYYDSALAMLALGSCKAANDDGCTNPDLESVSNWLFDEQTEKGCWNNNNLKDTAFLLYAGWPRTGSIGGGGGITDIFPDNATCSGVGGTCRSNCTSGEQTINAICSDLNLCCSSGNSGGYNPSIPTNCESAGYYCENRLGCLETAGEYYDEYQCATFDKVCCPVEIAEPSCLDQGGIICQDNEECADSIVSSSSGSCCLGDCNLIEELECVDDEDCNSDEECQDGECTLVDLPPPAQPEKSNTWLIVLLVILIILILVAIIYRNKIKIWLFSRKKGKGTGQAPPGARPPFGRMPPPRFGPSGMMQRPIVRPVMQPRPQMARAPPSRPRVSSAKDKEMEETLSKLKKMSE